MGRMKWNSVNLVAFVFILLGLVSFVRNEDNLNHMLEDDFSFLDDHSPGIDRMDYTAVREPRAVEHHPRIAFGCEVKPTAINAAPRCSKDKCIVACAKQHKFPGEFGSIIAKCENNQWINTKTSAVWEDMECHPTCTTPCADDEFCSAPNTCEPSFGPVPSKPPKKCTGMPKTPSNSQINCTSNACDISCIQKYKPNNGVKTILVKCIDGIWDTVPLSSLVCDPICDQSCANGGSCFSPNVCKCLDAYKGPLCQYSTSRCSTTKLKKFLAEVDCTLDEEKVSCNLTCASGFTFSHAAAPKYVCEYSKGEFIPKNIPFCISNVPRTTPTTTTKKPVSEDNDNLYRSETRSDDKTKASCATWNGDKIKTFDGLVYRNPLRCSHTLVENPEGSFKVILRSSPPGSSFLLPHALEIFLESEKYTFENNDGVVKMTNTKMELPIPLQISGLTVARSGNDIKILLEKYLLNIVWDTELSVQVEAEELMETLGICGSFDQDVTNDLTDKDGNIHKLPSAFVNTFKVSNLDKDPSCKTTPKSYIPEVCEGTLGNNATEICKQLWNNKELNACINIFNEITVQKFCRQDFCGCQNKQNHAECACRGVAALTKDCVFQDVATIINWRDTQICPMVCTNGKVYKSKGPIHEPACGSAIEDSTETREGCFCPDNQVLNDGECITPDKCPCLSGGKSFPAKSQISRECNKCTCQNGMWKCSNKDCDSRCSSYGDPHYLTFDGRKFGFMGKCSYYLMKTDEVSVEAENAACDYGENFVSNGAASYSCTKSVTIKFTDGNYNRTIQLKQNKVVLVDGLEIKNLPRGLSNGYATISQPSSTFVLVDFSIGIKVWFDGAARCNIDADKSFRGKTKGLCGNFNSNVKDDFETPDGLIETTVEGFANKWKTEESCPDHKETPHPCSKKPENKDKAEKVCRKIRESVFKDCHGKVDPETYYDNCLFDVCACENELESTCACPILTAYASECSRQGINLAWEQSIVECTVECPIGQEFNQCGDACTRTCSDAARESPCKLQCVEGCRCPQGLYLDDKTKECVPVAACNCIYKRKEFIPGHTLIREGFDSKETCTCVNAIWSCIKTPNVLIPEICDSSKNEEFTSCEPLERKTCKNQHLHYETSPADCEEGCICKNGFVYDTYQKKCVLKKDCSCQQAGVTHLEGDTIQMDCNTCSCNSGEWSCTKKVCNPTCSIWGDGHFTTFDGFNFDFLGACEYVLSKGKLDNGDGYSLTIQNVFCGSKGITCSKSLKIHLEGSSKETLLLSAGKKDLSQADMKKYSKILIHKAGVFKVIEIPHLGVQIKWDRLTRIYVKLDNKWKGRLQGLCGNYNDNIQDELKTPSYGIEKNPLTFGHSWKLDSSCKMPGNLSNACGNNPQRKSWSQQQCSVLKSSVFEKCHTKVPVDVFHKRCVFDSCACDQGGDCECLCTALSAYAHACAMSGAPIKWRSPDLCPMQCDPKSSSYSSCIPSCPVKTCDNFMTPNSQLLCSKDSCVEGCDIQKCPNENLIYKNDSFLECQPRSECKATCMVENGVSYFENDKMASDDCYTCTCSRGKKICMGSPCAKVPEDPPIPDRCLKPSEWTDWSNKDKLIGAGKTKKNDIEPLPDSCGDRIFMVECRTVSGHKNFSETGENVDCSIHDGLVCAGKCSDYEIRASCECEKDTNCTASPGFVRNECAYSCGSKACHYYKEIMISSETCGMNSHECIPGCVPEKNLTTCLSPKVRRDSQTCVDLSQCTCMSNTGKQVAPSKKVVESECETCQCLNNEYICANTCSPPIDPPVPASKCNPDAPIIEHFSECEIYRVCDDVVNDTRHYKDYECGPDDLFNPILLACSPLDDVYKVKPECKKVHKNITALKPVKYGEKSYRPTPPALCKTGVFIPTIDKLQASIAATSYLSPSYIPEYAKPNSKLFDGSKTAWIAFDNDLNQALEISYEKASNFYGIIVQGHPLLNQYVTSFKMMFSTDGVKYYYMQDLNLQPQLFTGPFDNGNPVRIDFDYPVEAKILRIIPLTWFGAISMRVEILACSPNVELPCKATNTCDPPVKAPLCKDPLGIQNDKIKSAQITFSSSLLHFGSNKNVALKLDSTTGWSPVTPRNDEFILFDFLAPRNLTGIITKGGANGWVKSYQVYWGNDVKNLKLMKKNGATRTFAANVNKFEEKINFFDNTVKARYLKIVPKSWLKNILMKVEPLGCFEDYPPQKVPLPEKPCSPSTCPGIQVPDNTICPCKAEEFWNGDKCVKRHECPCVTDGDTHKAGDIYQNEDCATCTCALYGLESCVKKECPDCGAGNYRVEPGTCSCECKKCPSGTRSCPSSQECIQEKSWCTGVKDCLDDETGCPPETPENKPTKCNELICPEGMILVSSNQSDIEISERPSAIDFAFKKNNLPISKTKAMLLDCPYQYCTENIGGNCSDCSVGLVPIKLSNVACPACMKRPTENSTCKINGQTITTFDKSEFKYDICDHMLVRDVNDKRINIILKKNCNDDKTTCTKQLTIIDKIAEYKLDLFQNMTIILNGISYTVDQLSGQNDFVVTISSVGDTILYNTMLRGIWVKLTNQGNIKLSTADQNLNQIDGLCGLYNNDISDDKQKPDGSISSSTLDFGDSWYLNENDTVVCTTQTCSKTWEATASKICNLAKSDVFKACGDVMDLDKYVDQCFESACECLSTDSLAAQTPEEKEDECKCVALGILATECMAASSKVQLDTWRAFHVCEVESCVAPFVHSDCYRHECEATCNNIGGCPTIEGACYSGCFCPDGQVKKGDSCVMASKCRNCVCDGFGQSQYLTYDRNNFTFDGNCTYLMSRDISSEKIHSFQVYATVAPCDVNADPNERSATCTQAIYLLHGSKKIHVKRASGIVLDVFIDDQKIKFPYNFNGIDIYEEGTELRIFLSKSLIELNIMFKNMAFNIKVPKLKYGNNMEGLCGNCNADKRDDLKENPANSTEISDPNADLTQKQKIDNFVWSWLADEPKLNLKEKFCQVDRKEPCLPLSPDTDPCFEILDNPVFQPCYLVVSPFTYISACQKFLCQAGPVMENVCEPISAYVRECARKNVCIDWRRSDFCNMNCESPFEYSACGCPETCDTVEAKNKLIASSSAAIQQDSKALAKISSSCKSNINEGCFCPKGKVQKDNLCMEARECKKCDQNHFLGDEWYTDKCTKCQCNSDGKSTCSTKTCPMVICPVGWTKVEATGGDDCCKKYTCVNEPKECNTTLPVCAENQENKNFKNNDTEPCFMNVCECVPKKKCPAIKSITSLEVGMKVEIDPTGCCEFTKVVCDKSKCPNKPINCSLDFYEVVIIRSIEVTKCCDIYDCKPPPKHCIATIMTRKQKMKIGDTWFTEDPCLTEMCVHDEDGKPKIDKKKKVCTEICQAGEELKTNPNECCGKCVRVQCVSNKVYNVGETWQIPGDNCTTFKCEKLKQEISISTSHTTCLDISDCPLDKIYVDGCCKRCKIPSMPIKTCVPSSMALNLTVGLIQDRLRGHGLCQNAHEIVGLSECTGVCDTYSKYNPVTFGQKNHCGCCKSKTTKEISVELTCLDGHKQKKNITVPLDCACAQGECSENIGGLTFSARLGGIKATQ